MATILHYNIEIPKAKLIQSHGTNNPLRTEFSTKNLLTGKLK